MEVIFHGDDHCFIRRDLFTVITPFPRELDRSFICLCPTVHEKGFLITESVADEFLSQAKFIVVKRAGSQRELLCLVDQRCNDPRMAMALIYSAVCRKEIVIALTLDIP